MRPLHALVLVIALAGLLLGAFLLLRDDGGRGRLAAPASAQAAQRADPGPSADLSAPDPETRGEERSAAPLSPHSSTEDRATKPAKADAHATALRGRVVDERGTPLAGVRVSAAPDSPWARRALERGGVLERDFARAVGTQTQADGRFRVELADTARALVALEAAGRAPFVEDFATRAGEERDLGDLVLQPSVVLAGRVLDAGGRAVEGARLSRASESELAFDFDAQPREPLAQTDASGSFRIDRLAPGPWALRIDHDEHPARVERGETRRAGERQEGLTFTLEDGVAIRGRLLEASAEQLAELEIVASPARSIDDLAPAGSAARTTRRVAPAKDGRFELPGLRAGESYRVQARSAPRQGQTFPGRGMTPVVVAEAGAQDVELRVRPLTSLSFQVVDDTSGEPIESFRAWAGNPFPMALRDADGRPSGEHPEGRARFEELPRAQGPLELRVDALGYHSYERKDVRVLEGRDNDLGTLRLSKAPILEVRVLDELDGRPIEGARVRLRKAQREQSEGVGFEAEDLELDLGDEAPVLAGGSRSARSDAEGRVRLTSLPGEQVVLSARAKGYAPREEGPFLLAEGADVQRELRLGPGGSVLVRVQDPAGAPVAGVGVEHRGPDGASDGLSFGGQRVTDAAGELRFEELAAGTHSFRLGDGSNGMVTFAQGGAQINVVRRAGGEDEEGGGRPWSEVAVLPREEARLTLLSQPHAEVRGIVREGGEPLAGATVSLSSASGAGAEDPFAGMGGFSGASPLEARTDHEGRFAIADVEVGRYRASVRHAERAMPWEQELEVGPEGLEVAFDLPIVGIRGVVRDVEGEPLAGVRVAAARPEVQNRTVRRMILVTDGGDVHGDVFDGDPNLRPVLTDEEGRYELKGLVPDVELVVKASGAGVQPGQSERLRLAPGEIAEGVDLELAAGGALPVEVSSASGEPAMGMVEARWSGEEQGVEPKSGFAGPSGRVRLDGLRPGKWTVSVRPLGMNGGPSEPVEREVEVRAGDNEAVQVRLP